MKMTLTPALPHHQPTHNILSVTDLTTTTTTMATKTTQTTTTTPLSATITTTTTYIGCDPYPVLSILTC